MLDLEHIILYLVKWGVRHCNPEVRYLIRAMSGWGCPEMLVCATGRQCMEQRRLGDGATELRVFTLVAFCTA